MTPTPAPLAPDAVVSDAAKAKIFHTRLVAGVEEAEAVLASDFGTANRAANRPVRCSKEEVAIGCDPAARYHRPVPTSGE